MKTFLLTILFAQSLLAASAVLPLHRECKEDKDCSVVLLKCVCMYCARPTDEADGIVAGVNTKFSESYKDLSKCSKGETAACAMAGACADFGKSVPACIKRNCAIVFQRR